MPLSLLALRVTSCPRSRCDESGLVHPALGVAQPGYNLLLVPVEQVGSQKKASRPSYIPLMPLSLLALRVTSCPRSRCDESGLVHPALGVAQPGYNSAHDRYPIVYWTFIRRLLRRYPSTKLSWCYGACACSRYQALSPS